MLRHIEGALSGRQQKLTQNRSVQSRATEVVCAYLSETLGSAELITGVSYNKTTHNLTVSSRSRATTEGIILCTGELRAVLGNIGIRLSSLIVQKSAD